MNLESLENLPRSQKILMVSLLAIIIVGGFVYFVFIPQKVAIDALKNSINEINRQINNDEVKVRRLDQLKMENQQLQLELTRLQHSFPQSRRSRGYSNRFQILV